MAYTLYDNQNQIITHAQLQLRGPWYEHGVRKELMFVERFGQEFNVTVNPEKERNLAAPDLAVGKSLGDLKCQNTPFFSARRYRMNAQTSVTFNLKDAFAYQQYLSAGESFEIYFWVDWIATRMASDYGETSVLPMSGVWHIAFRELDEIRRTSPIHWYNERARNTEKNHNFAAKLVEFEPRLQNDDSIYSIRSGIGGNAACSYLIDLKHFTQIA